MTYEVVIGNIGTVGSGSSKRDAVKCFNWYVRESKKGSSRVAGQSIYLMEDGNPINEYQGPADDDEYELDGIREVQGYAESLLEGE